MLKFLACMLSIGVFMELSKSIWTLTKVWLLTCMSTQKGSPLKPAPQWSSEEHSVLPGYLQQEVVLESGVATPPILVCLHVFIQVEELPASFPTVRTQKWAETSIVHQGFMWLKLHISVWGRARVKMFFVTKIWGFCWKLWCESCSSHCIRHTGFSIHEAALIRDGFLQVENQNLLPFLTFVGVLNFRFF